MSRRFGSHKKIDPKNKQYLRNQLRNSGLHKRYSENVIETAAIQLATRIVENEAKNGPVKIIMKDGKYLDETT